MLVGNPPFYDETNSNMFKKILKQDDLEFPDDIEISEDCKDFIE
jgi:hypothetical protein